MRKVRREKNKNRTQSINALRLQDGNGDYKREAFTPLRLLRPLRFKIFILNNGRDINYMEIIKSLSASMRIRQSVGKQATNKPKL